MSKKTDIFLQKTIDVWQPGYKKKLTQEDARQITENMTGFFDTLLEWEKNEASKDTGTDNVPKENGGLPPKLAVN